MLNRFFGTGSSFLLLLFTFSSTAQTTNFAEDIQQHITNFSDGSYAYEQEMTAGEKPYLLTFTRTEVNEKKGDSEVFVYTFNAGLVDKNLINIKSEKKSIRLFVKTGKEPYIKVTEDGEYKGYTDEFAIHCEDIDIARLMKKTLENAAVEGEKAWKAENVVPEDFEALAAYLKENLTDAARGEDRTEQTLTFDEKYPDRVFIETESFDEKGTEGKTDYAFSLGDLQPRTQKPEVKKGAVTLELKTEGGRNFIKTTDENGEVKFTDAAILYFESPEKAMLYADATEAAAKAAKAKIAERSVPPTDYAAARTELQNLIGEATYKGDKVSQNLNFENDLVTLDRSTFDDKGGEEKEFYLFDFGDFKKLVKAEFSNDYGSIEIKTDGSKNDFVYVEEDGEQKNYSDEIVFYTSDVETLRRIETLLPFLIENAPKEIAVLTPDEFFGTLTDADSPDFDQTAERDTGTDDCKVKITQTEQGKKTDEAVLTFNLDDLDPKSVELKISGKEVAVVAETRGREKIIQVYENGEDLEYADEIVLRVSDIATGKRIRASLAELISGCAE